MKKKSRELVAKEVITKKDIHRAWLKSMEKRDDDVLSKARILREMAKKGVKRWVYMEIIVRIVVRK